MSTKQSRKAPARTERDSLGEIAVDSRRAWGAQTQRSLMNFPIGTEKMPPEIIRAFGILKQAAAETNAELGVLDRVRAEAIAAVSRQIAAGKLNDEFPLSVWQTGSGTQTNMNANEVIAYIGNKLLEKAGRTERLHPNDHVNRSQSSNDTFPTAMHVAAVEAAEESILPALRELKNTLKERAERYKEIVKIGRTHLMDATPLTLGQEIGGWASMLSHAEEAIRRAEGPVMELALGGTAVGTGLNAPADFGERVAARIAEKTGYPFVTAPNKFHALTSKDALVTLHGALKALAADLMKIANDVRWLASGPRSGLAEIRIPANEPGSSIMPGKVNPTQCEALAMVCVQVMGNDVAIGIAASQGNFELNVYMPVLIHAFLQSARLLGDAMRSFNIRCAKGIEPNEEVIRSHLERSLMLVTALSPVIGYDRAAEIARTAYEKNLSLREAVVESGTLPEEEFDRIVDPEKMV